MVAVGRAMESCKTLGINVDDFREVTKMITLAKGAQRMLPSQTQWQTMGAIEGGTSWSALRDGFNGVGGTNLSKNYYWSSTEFEIIPSYAWMFDFDDGRWVANPKDYDQSLVRACLAF